MRLSRTETPGEDVWCAVIGSGVDRCCPIEFDVLALEVHASFAHHAQDHWCATLTERSVELGCPKW
jgi:hypothetical protein